MKYVDKIVIEENGQLLRIPIEEFVVADHINSIIRGINMSFLLVAMK